MRRIALLCVLAGRAAAPAGYVNAKVCAECHREIAEAYGSTGMARTFYRPSPENTKEDYSAAADIYHAPSDSHYAMIRRGGEYFQRRWQIGLDGREINVEEMRIDYVVGSGNHLRAYLHRTERGMLIEMPLGWYPQPGWAMVPGSDNAHPFTRRFVSYRCMGCHNAYPSIPAANEAPDSEPVYTTPLPEGIDCQRCHGPGGAHVQEVRRKGATAESVRASIVNPARLSPKLQMDTCMQCHLETSSQVMPTMVMKFDRGPFSYTPGQPLENLGIAFDHAPGTGHEDKFEGVGAPYRLRQSRCFLESGERLTCLTCHDPHRIPRGEEAVRFYAGICRQCHATPKLSSGNHPAGEDCVSCHMPQRRSDDAPHVAVTDHLIQRRPAADLMAEFPEHPAEEYRGEVVPYYPSPFPKTDLNELYRAVAQVGLGNNVKAGMPDLVRAIDIVKPAQAEFYMVLGGGWRALGKPEQAIAAYEQAVRLSNGGSRELVALASVLPADQAEVVLKRAVAAAPGDPEPLYQYGLLTESAEMIRRAIAMDPTMPEKSRNLAGVLLRAGRGSEAADAARDALRADPFDDAAWDVAGKALAEDGKFPEAFFDFERAIRLHPRADFLYDYALALVRADRYEEAETEAGMAVRADSGLGDAHELLGGLYLRKGQLADAAREYRAAIAVHPDRERLRQRLASVLAQQGKP